MMHGTGKKGQSRELQDKAGQTSKRRGLAKDRTKQDKTGQSRTIHDCLKPQPKYPHPYLPQHNFTQQILTQNAEA